MNIKDLIKGDVTFEYYFDGNLWYKTENHAFFFPVPISDIGTAKFLAKDRAMLFMRYIRKHLDLIEKKDNGQQEV